MTSDVDGDIISVKEYAEGRVIVVDDIENYSMFVRGEGAVEFEREFSYGEGTAHSELDDARGNASYEAKVFADGASEALRADYGGGLWGDGE